MLWRPAVTEWARKPQAPARGCPIGQDWAQWVAWCKFTISLMVARGSFIFEHQEHRWRPDRLDKGHVLHSVLALPGNPGGRLAPGRTKLLSATSVYGSQATLWGPLESCYTFNDEASSPACCWGGCIHLSPPSGHQPHGKQLGPANLSSALLCWLGGWGRVLSFSICGWHAGSSV